MLGDTMTTAAHDMQEKPITVSALVDKYGPFLPYTLLYGLPLDLPDDYPLWTNLLSPRLRPIGFFGSTWREAMRPALVAVETLILTTEPERLVVMAQTPAAYTEIVPPKPERWEPLAIQPVVGVNGSQPDAFPYEGPMACIVQELQARITANYRGPVHWVILLIGFGVFLREEAEEHGKYHAWVRALFEHGPKHAMWAFVVDTYTYWREWRTFPFGPVVLTRWTQESVDADVARFIRDRGYTAPGILRDLNEHQALLCARNMQHVFAVPEPDRYAWNHLLTSFTEAKAAPDQPRKIAVPERRVQVPRWTYTAP